MNRFIRRVVIGAVSAAVLLGAVLVWADITGSISGFVFDPSGAVVSGATLEVTSVATNVKHTTTSDSKGFYSFPSLSVGVYNISITQSGFRDVKEEGISIDANSAVRIDVKLQVGSVVNTIQVQSDAPVVETQSTQMGEVIESAKITSVPLNGRSYIDLLALQPGVSPYQDHSGVDTTGVGATTISGDQSNGSQSVNGGRLGSNGFMVNGADAEEGVHNGAAMIPNLDSIAEFRIITNNFNAEYGNYSGGQINVVTKSGTNKFHGDVFDFLRNTDLDAKNYFSSQRGVFIQNQFGGIIGGPIKKDKVFFFADYQGTKQILGQTQSFAVPTTADRGGNLLDAAVALTGSVAGTSWAQTLSTELGRPVTQGEPYYTASCTVANNQCVFPNAFIPQSAWSPVAVNTLKYIPVPNAALSNGANYQASSPNGTLTDNKGGFRLDTNTRYGSLFGYYFFDQFSTITPYTQGITVPGFDSTNQGRTQMVNLGLTTTLNNSMVNDIRLVYLRDVNHTGQPQGGTGVSLASLGFNTPWNSTGGIGAIKPSLEGIPSFAFNNYSFGLPQDALNQYNNTLQIIDNVAKIFGTHTLQFGADFHYDQINERNYDDTNGAFGFNGQETGLDFADFLIGAPANFTQASQQLLDSRTKYFGVYAQDSWRVRSTLTLNYGLRYEIMPPWYDTQNKLETLIPGEQSRAFPTAPVGLVVPGDPGVPRTLAPVQYHNFAPRVGFAYSPDVAEGLLGKIFGGPGKTSIRGGYGMFYSSFEDATGFVEVGDAPYGLYYNAQNTLLASPFIDRATGTNAGQKFPFTFPPTNVSPSHPDTTFNWTQATPISGGDYFYSHNKTPYVQQYDLSLQRQLGASTVMSVSYVGSVGRHLLTFEDANPATAALCLALNAQLPTGATQCGPGLEDNTYTLVNGATLTGPTVVTVGGVKEVQGTRPTFGNNFGSNPYMKAVVSSSFNSLQVSLKHSEKYAEFLLGYTFEKSMDNGSTSFDATNPFNPRLSRALSLFDVPQDLVLSYTIQLPFNNFIGKSEIAKKFTAGWSLSGISTFASGEPVQLSESDDNSLSGTFNDSIDEPSYVPNAGPLYGNRNPRSGQPYFNPNYFQPEPVGQVGNAMRRFFSGPGIFNSDVALSKDTQISEGKQLQFRAEAFNVFNHAQFKNPSGDVNNTGTGGFGYVTSARDPRIMQIALKLLF